MKKDGKTEKTSRGCKKRNSQSKRGGLESISCPSKSNGTEQIGASSENREGGDTDRRFAISEFDPGKILERLHQIEQKYLAYVDAHQERLKTRLQESIDDKTEFVREVRELESDILAVIEQQTQQSKHTE